MKLRARALELLVFTVGAGTLGSEMAAARLLAPWFGDSTIVWANTIATVLVALAIGYSVGGRIADRNPHPSGLAKIVLVAAALLAAVPFIADPFLPLAVRAVDQLSIATFAGSLVGVGVLLAIPLFLLGIVSPYAVRLTVEAVEDAGHAAGRLYAISTVGSLVGTFAASLLLIPVVGTRRTFLIFALLMAVCAIPHLVKRRLPAAVVPAVILALIALPTGSIKTLTSNGGEVIWEKETEYQYARVVEYDDGSRYLELNEGHAVHSVYNEGEWLTGAYWDEMLSLSYAGRSRWRSWARPPGRPRASSATSPPRPGWTPSRSTRTSPRSARSSSTSRTSPTSTSTPPTPARGCRSRAGSTTRSWSTPTTSPTSRST
jgi:predicted membrane-bound spermidine synthase